MINVTITKAKWAGDQRPPLHVVVENDSYHGELLFPFGDALLVLRQFAVPSIDRLVGRQIQLEVSDFRVRYLGPVREGVPAC